MQQQESRGLWGEAPQAKRARLGTSACDAWQPVDTPVGSLLPSGRNETSEFDFATCLPFKCVCHMCFVIFLLVVLMLEAAASCKL